ncbi:GNAT family N-acetyltransferase [Pseudobutyrivibrio xylanivorans]|uniref:GNAT family N-acetyltransferase n=1 Tax=Pseudobutyrivibrio xylanivorans TaxID=185007 RepID=A0A5P6VLK4_PSEXY|nr:GNAT family N-acetyltransferase [Pseudobutyrivibrio xylanivorans]QFJ53525.1 GNAT family N-acetyltransferase [Pseudobutyrivibrio xylanivorans]
MSNVYEECPVLENDRFLLRFVTQEDATDLLKVYSDKNALPFFNSDNCHGDNFYYPTKEKMDKAIDFWLYSYNQKFFVRWTIIDKKTEEAIGTIELFHRTAEDDFNHVGVLRLDVRSDYEKAETINELLSIIILPSYDLFECTEIISKVPVYAIERMDAFSKYGFEKSETLLEGTMDHYLYKDYWKIIKGKQWKNF